MKGHARPTRGSTRFLLRSLSGKRSSPRLRLGSPAAWLQSALLAGGDGGKRAPLPSLFPCSSPPLLCLAYQERPLFPPTKEEEEASSCPVGRRTGRVSRADPCDSSLGPLSGAWRGSSPWPVEPRCRGRIACKYLPGTPGWGVAGTAGLGGSPSPPPRGPREGPGRRLHPCSRKGSLVLVGTGI